MNSFLDWKKNNGGLRPRRAGTAGRNQGLVEQYGNLLTNVLLAAVLAVCGLAGLELVSAQPAGQSAAVYSVLQKPFRTRTCRRSRRQAANCLKSSAARATPPWELCPQPRRLVEADDAKTAKVPLSLVAENGKRTKLRDLARLRLAICCLMTKAFDEAFEAARRQCKSELRSSLH